MRPGANRRDHDIAGGWFDQPILASMRPGANRRDHVRGEEGEPIIVQGASMRPGANRRDHPGHQRGTGLDPDASMRPGANRRDHHRSQYQPAGPRFGFNEARRESPGSRLALFDVHHFRGAASMRPGANRRDHQLRGHRHPGIAVRFNEARRESPGSRRRQIEGDAERTRLLQ